MSAQDRQSRFEAACMHLTPAQRLVAESAFRAADKQVDTKELISLPKGYAAFVQSKIDERKRVSQEKKG